jgi:prepilin-type N-terminal cleavage/methylation domain-containing protein
MYNNRQKLGFTLVELSIVIIIIGLIAGGVLVGKSLIQSAEVKGIIKKFYDTQTNMNTF